MNHTPNDEKLADLSAELESARRFAHAAMAETEALRKTIVTLASIEPNQVPVIEGWIKELDGDAPIEGDPDGTQNLIGQLENILTKLSKKNLY
jgi:hypothetical protein